MNIKRVRGENTQLHTPENYLEISEIHNELPGMAIVIMVCLDVFKWEFDYRFITKIVIEKVQMCLLANPAYFYATCK